MKDLKKGNYLNKSYGDATNGIGFFNYQDQLRSFKDYVEKIVKTNFQSVNQNAFKAPLQPPLSFNE